MNKKLLLKKFQEFKKNIEYFVEFDKNYIEDVHSLRLSVRELLSLMSFDDIFYKKLKQVIKLSNEIRDLDVFYEVYLDSLPKKYITKLDLKSMRYFTRKSREKRIDKLHIYLNSLVIPKTIKFEYQKSEFDFIAKEELTSLDYVELHKYRIFIKRILYKKKNSLPMNEKKIKNLKDIKDVLGNINDNINGLNRLNSFKIEQNLLKKIVSFTENQNLKLFKKFQNLDNEYKLIIS